MNQSKWILPAVVTLALAITVLLPTGCGKPAAESTPADGAKTAEGTSQIAKYTCPMHPEVLQDKAGKCPKCGMNLVVKK